MSTAAPDGMMGALKKLISSDQFGAGARLPTERELAGRLQTNRATIRKALALLEHEGRITRHVGRGTFVAATAARPDLAAASSPLELMDARLLLEPVIAREAALRARLSDLQRMENLLRKFDAAEEYAEFETWDIQFHQVLAQATQNVIFASVDDMMRNLRSTPEWDKFKRASFSADTRRLYRREHRTIFSALVERDAMRAGQAMEMHIRSIRARLTG